MRHLIPNSTQIPDVILDHWMAHLSGADFKVLLYIARRTYGFGRGSAAISLSQIANGIVKRDGTRLDWGTGGSRSSVARSLKSLEEVGLVIKSQNINEEIGDFDQNTYAINLDWMPEEGNEPPIPSNGEANGATKGVVSNRDHPVSKPDRGWSQDETRGGAEMRPGVVSNRDHIRETVKETENRETAAAVLASKPKPQGMPKAPAAAFDFEEGEELTPEGLALSEELIRAGLNRVDAKRLAANSPEECRRQLDYLPFKTDLKNPGAYLRQAIEGSYGPPASYHEARKQETEAQKKRALAESQAAKKAEAERRAEEAAAVLDREIEKMREEDPQSFTSFETFVEAERSRVVSRLPSVRLQDTMNREFRRPEKRREFYQLWRAKA